MSAMAKRYEELDRKLHEADGFLYAYFEKYCKVGDIGREELQKISEVMRGNNARSDNSRL
jgi:hypothetical protein